MPRDPAKQRAAKKKWYEENKQVYYDRNKAKKERNREYIREYKLDKPCVDCDTTYPHYVMDFDHRDPSQKFKEVSKLVNHSLETIKKEIEKCDLVCSNCHRIRTHSGEW